MAVAKSYEHMEIITEPFLKNGRKYVRVKGKCDRCGGSGIWSWGPYGGTCFKCNGSGNDIQEVRWYTDKERAVQDRQAEKRAEARVQRQLERDAYEQGAEYNGFIDGFVIAVLGNTYEIKDELKEAGAKYTRGLGWHFANTADVPAKYTDRTRMIMWEDASIDGKIKSVEELERLVAVAAPIDDSVHKYFLGSRVRDLTLKVYKVWQGPGYTMHTFVDSENNVYLWTTSSRTLPLDAQVTMDVTIKEHTEYKGVKQTVLTRPRIKEVVTID